MLVIPASLYAQLLKTAQMAMPLEVVGILAGGEKVQEILPLANIAVQPSKEFFASPNDLAQALRHMRTQNLKLLAFYHSHPQSPAVPSQIDYERAYWDVPMLILDVQNQRARAWNLETAQEVPVVLSG
ncbi:MAG: Mov34/MPN/PAD-1 family protein [Deinococcales bacterium]